MYKAISLVLFLMYKLYEQSKRDRQGAYELSIFLFLFVVFLNICSLLVIFNSMDLIPWNSFEPNSSRFFKIGVYYLIPGYLAMALIFRKKHIINLQYDDEKVFWGKMIVGLYAILSFVTLIIIAIYKTSTK
jgi:hypothetical protein